MVMIAFVGVATFDKPGKGATSILQSVVWRTSLNVLSTRLGDYRYHAGTMVQKGSRVTAIYDIHGNLPALEAVLAELESVTPDLIVVGGDVVAGPMPTEVMDRLVTLGEPMPIGRSLQPMTTGRTLTLWTWQTPRSASLRTPPLRSAANTGTY
jgi:hypothetical protein